MGYASKLGKARASSRNPTAAGICDACGFAVQLSDLSPNREWAGNVLINKKQLVCRRCQDVPNQQLRAIVLPADPAPILNPRPPNYCADAADFRSTSGQNTVDPWTGIPIPGTVMRITENDDERVTQQTGKPYYSYVNAPGTIPVNPSAPGNEDPGVPCDNTDVPLADAVDDFDNDFPVGDRFGRTLLSRANIVIADRLQSTIITEE